MHKSPADSLTQPQRNYKNTRGVTTIHVGAARARHRGGGPRPPRAHWDN